MSAFLGTGGPLQQSIEDVVIVGAGPIGLACALALKRRGMSTLLLERGCVADAVRRFPIDMTFFSTSELIEIGGLPLVTQGIRPSRFEALKYYGKVADVEKLRVERHSEVVALERADEGFEIRARSTVHGTERSFRARFAILATGYYTQPNLLSVPGENLPHVSHYYDEAARYAHTNVVVVGGQNSACDTALDLFRSGARVTLVHRQPELGRSVKYWIRPDIENRIRGGEIRALFSAEVSSIDKNVVSVRSIDSGSALEVPADFVFIMTGYHPDVKLLSAAGVRFDADSLVPEFDPQSFETNIPGLFVAGSTTAGKRTSDIFIENGRAHAAVIAERIASALGS